MPISDAAVKAFYDELVADGDLEPAVRESLLSVMEKKESKFKSGVMAQRDYQSSKEKDRNELARAKKDYEDKLESVAGLEEQMRDGSVSKTELAKIIAERDAERAALRTLQTDYLGVVNKIRESYTNADEIIKTAGLNPTGVVVPTVTAGAAAAATTASGGQPANLPDLTNYIDRNTGNQMMGQVLDLMFDLPEITQEYQDLTGKRLSTREVWTKLQANANSRNPLEPKAFIEKEYGFGDLRTAKTERDIQARIDKAVEEKVTALESKRLAAAATSDAGDVRSIFGDSAEKLPPASAGPNQSPPGATELYKDAESAALAALSKARSADTHVM